MQCVSNKPGCSILKRCLLICSFMLASQHAVAEDLWDVYQLALKNDARYLAAESRFEAAKLDLPLAKTGLKPSVSANGTLGKIHSDAGGSSTTGNNNQIGVSLDLSVYNRALNIGISQAELLVENARLEFDIAREELTLRVAESYFNLLAARDSKDVERLQKIAIKRQMDLAAERLDVGLGTRTDLYDAKARYQQANADLIAADISINNARQALIEIINLTPKIITSLEENSPLDLPEPNDIDHWINIANSGNLRIKAEKINLQIADHEINRQRAARHPTVSFGASQRWSDGSSSGIGGDANTTSLGFTLNLPFYRGGATNLRTRQAGIRFNASELALESVRRRITSEVTSSFLSVTSGISQVEALAEAIRAGESALEAKEEGFSAGLTTNLDVLDAQRDLSRSRTDYLRAKYNYIISLLKLEQATGDLGDEDIRHISQWLTDSPSAYRLDYSDNTRLVAHLENTNASANSFGLPAMMSFATAIQ